MATPSASSAQPTKTASEYGSDIDIASVTALSDYGSDIGLEDIDEDVILANVLGTLKHARSIEGDCVLPSLEFEGGEREDENGDEDHQHGDSDGCVQMHRPALLRVAKGREDPRQNIASSPLREHEALEIEYDERSRRAWSGTLETSHMTCGLLHGSTLDIPWLTTNSA
jgi:exonuclease V